jgi:hypothetical protein
LVSNILFGAQRTSDSDYEKILAELDDLIRKTEIRIAELRIKEKRVLGGLLVYALSIYVVLLAGSFILFRNQNWEYKLGFMIFFILYPPLVYMIKRLISFAYRRWLNGDRKESVGGYEGFCQKNLMMSFPIGIEWS